MVASKDFNIFFLFAFLFLVKEIKSVNDIFKDIKKLSFNNK